MSVTSPAHVKFKSVGKFLPLLTRCSVVNVLSVTNLQTFKSDFLRKVKVY